MDAVRIEPLKNNNRQDIEQMCLQIIELNRDADKRQSDEVKRLNNEVSKLNDPFVKAMSYANVIEKLAECKVDPDYSSKLNFILSMLPSDMHRKLRRDVNARFKQMQREDGELSDEAATINVNVTNVEAGGTNVAHQEVETYINK